MNQPVRYVAMVVAILISAGEAFALDTALSPLYISGKIGVSAMSANDIAKTSGTAFPLTKPDAHDTVVPVGVAIGYNWRKHGVSLRTEFEYLTRANFGYNSTPVLASPAQIGMTSKIGSQTLFANVFYDFHNATRFTPFVGGGIGVAINKSTMTLNAIPSSVFETFKTTDTKFAWNIGAGVAVPITEILLLELSYRYTDLGGAVWSTNTGAFELTTNSLRANEFLFAARLQF
ncbi:MAG: outer membrane beta-barrel protein [Nitrospirota bacterium]|jgi:opacity protein-like surface antigen